MNGMVFGRLTVIDKTKEKSKDNRYDYICKCECGKEVVIKKTNLTTGKTKSCGCLNSEKLKNRHKECRENFNSEQYLNKIFGRLTVIEYVGFLPKDDPKFNCLCSCGNICKNITIYNLLSSNTKSCGCIKKEIWAEGLNEYEAILNKRERGNFTRSNIRKNILDRDKHKCYLCKKEDVKLHVHHIEQWKDNQELRYSCRNLITLCFDCHFFKAHGNVGEINSNYTEKFKKYTKEKECICNLCVLDNEIRLVNVSI